MLILALCWPPPWPRRLAGLLVGIPSLRLRGDYLAIVTLGFGEIIRVLILNIDAVGGARGFSGIPKLSNFFWVYLLVAAVDRDGAQPGALQLRPRLHLDPRERDRRRGDGRGHDPLQGAGLRDQSDVRGHGGRPVRALTPCTCTPTPSPS